MIARMNFATALAFGRELGLAEPPDALRLAWPASRASSLDRVVGSLAETLLGADPGAGRRDRITRLAGTGSPSLAEWRDGRWHSFCPRLKLNSLDPAALTKGAGACSRVVTS